MILQLRQYFGGMYCFLSEEETEYLLKGGSAAPKQGGSAAPKQSGSAAPNGSASTAPERSGSGAQTVNSSVDNPGVCPMSAVDISAGCALESVTSCIDDSSCALNQKCCLQGCSFRCVTITSMARATSMARVRSRQRAQGRSRFSTSSTSLFCPASPRGAFSNGCGGMKSCTANNDCEGNQRCCYFPCGKVCVNPVSIVGLSNEKEMRARTATAANATVSANASASAGAASAGAASAAKDGVCPTMATNFTVAEAVACSVDSECSGAMKCCAHGRGFGCMDPITVMSLPSALMGTRMQVRHNGGSERDVLRSRAVCPNVDFDPGMACGTACEMDNNCGDSQLCCPVGNCQECENPVISQAFVNARPGICPSFSPDIDTNCVVECNMDNDCEVDGMKCCSVGCAKKCVNPIATMAPTTKAGTCPAIPAARSVRHATGSHSFNRARGRNFHSVRTKVAPNNCGFHRFSNCRVDSDCRGDSKCCRNSCGGMRCMWPV
ncbi:uncharacterized protein LOC135464540 [Liolophura sinensis]|uniref:uncharacterized protein LOC135464540 n=1 Tax=Liolophura sinensis TaxID=3198878 RepID=UPI0031589AF8